MRKSLEDLIEVAYDVTAFCEVESFDLHVYDGGSCVDFHVRGIFSVGDFMKMIPNLQVRILLDEKDLLVRLFENYSEE